jgi:hypothetical protein
MAIVQTHHGYIGFDIERDPATLRARILRDFDFTHDDRQWSGRPQIGTKDEYTVKRYPILPYNFLSAHL